MTVPSRPRVLVAPDSFKGCLSAGEVAAALSGGVHQRRPGADVRLIPMADGGEGTLEVVQAGPGAARRVLVASVDPHGHPTPAPLVLHEATGVAWIEVAAVAGLHQVSPGGVDGASTAGVGVLVRAAQALGATTVRIAAGGTGTVDGGAGALQARALDLLDGQGRPIPGGFDGLERLERVGPSPSLPMEIEVLCDVQAPLLGPQGAAQLFGPQKGCTPTQIQRAERALDRLAAMLSESTGRDPRTLAGAGAAGGLTGGLWAGLGARLTSGFHALADQVGLTEAVESSDLVITGEGRLDGQTATGKVICGLAELCAAADVPLAVVAGDVTAEGSAWAAARGIEVRQLGDARTSVETRIADARALLTAAARDLRALR